MKEKLLKLKELSSETMRSHFSIYFNQKKSCWIVYFTILKLSVEDEDPEVCIHKAISYIAAKRVLKGEKFTL